MNTMRDLVIRLQKAAKTERGKEKRALLIEAARFIWDYNTQNEEGRIPIPCPECGSSSTDCGCD